MMMSGPNDQKGTCAGVSSIFWVSHLLPETKTSKVRTTGVGPTMSVVRSHFISSVQSSFYGNGVDQEIPSWPKC